MQAQAGALSQGVKYHRSMLVRTLLKNGTSVNERDTDGRTALIIASGLGDTDMVQLLLENGADPNMIDNNGGTSPLHECVQNGNIDVARLLLDHGARIDMQSASIGHTALMDAVWNKRLNMVRYLLSRGANLNIKSPRGYTAMDIAKKDNIKEIIAALNEEEAKRDAIIKQQKLMAAVQKNNLKAVENLLAQKVDLEARYPMVGTLDDGHTPLMVAARDGYLEIVIALVKAGANVNATDNVLQATAGNKAAYYGHADVLEVLIKNGLKVNTQVPYNGYTALHDAVWHGHKDCVQVLINANADITIKGDDGYSAEDLAMLYGYKDIATMLREHYRKTVPFPTMPTRRHKVHKQVQQKIQQLQGQTNKPVEKAAPKK
jgi:ankyrin repeat protein